MPGLFYSLSMETNASEDVSMILPVELYDAEGNKINDNRLTTSIQEVQCVATILATKEIPIVFTSLLIVFRSITIALF